MGISTEKPITPGTPVIVNMTRFNRGPSTYGTIATSYPFTNLDGRLVVLLTGFSDPVPARNVKAVS